MMPQVHPVPDTQVALAPKGIMKAVAGVCNYLGLGLLATILIM